MNNIFAGIVKQAVVDYRTQKEEVRDFFKSAWGKYVCGQVGCRAEVLLEKLEQDYDNIVINEEEL